MQRERIQQAVGLLIRRFASFTSHAGITVLLDVWQKCFPPDMITQEARRLVRPKVSQETVRMRYHNLSDVPAADYYARNAQEASATVL